MKQFSSLAATLVLLAGVAVSGSALAASDKDDPRSPPGGWPFAKLVGAHFDRESAQRGFQVYKEVCASCHGLDFVAFRTLTDIGFNEDEVKAIASEYYVMGEPDDYGEVEERPALPSDHFPNPYPNPQAAAFANGGSVPPDLSLITKARGGGPDYLYSLLTGYRDPTEEDLAEMAEQGLVMPDTAYFNPYKAGRVIAMAPPLFEGAVAYADGQPEATLDQMAYDVTMFLHWTAEPKLEERNQIGFRFMILLFILCGLLFFSYRRVAKRVMGH
ncbi:MAG: cytochrome c1 [Alphaproteobacteria bacterium]